MKYRTLAQAVTMSEVQSLLDEAEWTKYNRLEVHLLSWWRLFVNPFRLALIRAHWQGMSVCSPIPTHHSAANWRWHFTIAKLLVLAIQLNVNINGGRCKSIALICHAIYAGERSWTISNEVISVESPRRRKSVCALFSRLVATTNFQRFH